MGSSLSAHHSDLAGDGGNQPRVSEQHKALFSTLATAVGAGEKLSQANPKTSLALSLGCSFRTTRQAADEVNGFPSLLLPRALKVSRSLLPTAEPPP